MDRILIRDLELRCILGINEEERVERQQVRVNLALDVDLHVAGKSDSLGDTVDYSALKERIVAMAERSRYHLAEALAEEIAEICLAQPKVVRVRVTVEKPTALRFVQSVGVEIVRERP